MPSWHERLIEFQSEQVTLEIPCIAKKRNSSIKLIEILQGMEMRPGSMGKPAPGMDVKVVDDAGEEASRGEEGNLGIRCGPDKTHGLFTGYLSEGGSQIEYKTAGHFYLTGAKMALIPLEG